MNTYDKERLVLRATAKQYRDGDGYVPRPRIRPLSTKPPKISQSFWGLLAGRDGKVPEVLAKALSTLSEPAESQSEHAPA